MEPRSSSKCVKKTEESPSSGDGGTKSSSGLVDLIACLAVILAGVSLHAYSAAKNELRAFREENLNVTGNLDQEGIIFNRVPKVGSETIWTLIGDKVNPEKKKPSRLALNTNDTRVSF